MKIHEYNEMMRYLTRPGKVLANNINNKKISNTDERTALKRGGSDTKVASKNSKMLQYINDMNIVYGDKKATKEDAEAAAKRIEVRPKEMSYQDQYNTYFNKKSPKYYNNRVATKPTEENLYEVWLEMKKAGELPNMNFKEFETQYPNLDITKKKKPISTHTAGLWSNIKNSSIYKLLENEKLLGTELGHESLIELIHLAQNTGLLKKGGRVK